MRALLRQASDAAMLVDIPATALAQVWRDGKSQIRLARLLAASEVRTVDLDTLMARRVGELCGLTGTSDVVNAHVALHARLRDLAVVTSDPQDFRRLGGDLHVIAI